MIDIIDSHCHLDRIEFDQDRDQVIERAQLVGVNRIITIGAGGGGFGSAEKAQQLITDYSNIYASIGVHPHDAEVNYDVDYLEKLATHPKVVAIGETGLDFFRDWSPEDRQIKWFVLQIELAKKLNKPLIIHSRNAASKVISLLIEHQAHQVGGVFHCFSENAEFANQLTELGFYVSFPGSLTFKKAGAMRDIVRDIPLDRILVETDAPFMAPEPYRGKRCESSFVVKVVEVIATIKNISLEACAKTLTANTEKLFCL
jgi:TatD DNase family protein